MLTCLSEEAGQFCSVVVGAVGSRSSVEVEWYSLGAVYRRRVLSSEAEE